jgi:NTP pyrophosphatase (non-canonical NTP hydrolase)
MKNNYIQILTETIDTFGHRMQTMVAIEEMSELTKELVKHMRGQDNRDAIAEEIADVEIMLCQLRLMHGIKTTDIDALIAGKINRLKNKLEGKDSG